MQLRIHVANFSCNQPDEFTYVLFAKDVKPVQVSTKRVLPIHFLEAFQGVECHLKHLDLANTGIYVRDEELKWLVTTGHASELTCVRMRSADAVSNKAFRALAKARPDLQQLKLSWMGHRINNKALRAFAKCIANLKALHLNRLDMNDIALQTLANAGCGQYLEKLVLRDMEITDVGVQALTEHSLSLRELSLVRLKQVTDGSLETLAATKPLLTRLELHELHITDAGLLALVEAGCTTNLTYLSLFVGEKEITNDSLLALADTVRGNKFTHFRLRRMRDVTDEGVDALLQAGCFSSVQDFEVSFMGHGVTNATLETIKAMGFLLSTRRCYIWNEGMSQRIHIHPTNDLQ